MRWFRESTRPAAYAALLALLLQLALSFGHVHPMHAGAPDLAAAAGNAGEDTQPPGTATDHDDHYCAIYALLALLTGAQLAAAPLVSVPTMMATAEISADCPALHFEARRGAFQSRAPPLA